MNAILYCSPLVPPEWIAAHGMQPKWLEADRPEPHRPVHVARGICANAAAILNAVRSLPLVLTTTCDQMRRAAGLAERAGGPPIFLMNVPATWQTPTARRLYRDELDRLGRFLVSLGGRTPGAEDLARVMRQYEQARRTLCAARREISARQFAEALVEVRSGAVARDYSCGAPLSEPDSRVPLALLGGPLLRQDREILDLVEQSGGSIVLDAAEGGERTLPPAFDASRLAAEPIEALVDAYFLGIPDVFRRPNNALYRWLADRVATRRVRGILFRRYVWCDLWHAELFRLKQWSPVPVLEIDVADDEGSVMCRTLGRLEAFLEMLR